MVPVPTFWTSTSDGKELKPLGRADDLEVIEGHSAAVHRDRRVGVAPRVDHRPAADAAKCQALVDPDGLPIGAVVDAQGVAVVRVPERPVKCVRAGPDLGRGGDGPGRNGERPRQHRETDEDCMTEHRQWCSMTRSTMLYPTASSALMK
jgi:hypothetical protein